MLAASDYEVAAADELFRRMRGLQENLKRRIVRLDILHGSILETPAVSVAPVDYDYAYDAFPLPRYAFNQEEELYRMRHEARQGNMDRFHREKWHYEREDILAREGNDRYASRPQSVFSDHSRQPPFSKVFIPAHALSAQSSALDWHITTHEPVPFLRHDSVTSVAKGVDAELNKAMKNLHANLPENPVSASVSASVPAAAATPVSVSASVPASASTSTTSEKVDTHNGSTTHHNNGSSIVEKGKNDSSEIEPLFSASTNSTPSAASSSSSLVAAGRSSSSDSGNTIESKTTGLSQSHAVVPPADLTYLDKTNTQIQPSASQSRPILSLQAQAAAQSATEQLEIERQIDAALASPREVKSYFRTPVESLRTGFELNSVIPPPVRFKTAGDNLRTQNTQSNDFRSYSNYQPNPSSRPTMSPPNQYHKSFSQYSLPGVSSSTPYRTGAPISAAVPVPFEGLSGQIVRQQGMRQAQVQQQQPRGRETFNSAGIASASSFSPGQRYQMQPASGGPSLAPGVYRPSVNIVPLEFTQTYNAPYSSRFSSSNATAENLGHSSGSDYSSRESYLRNMRSMREKLSLVA